jgi:polysaccharide export outer membrane protein
MLRKMISRFSFLALRLTLALSALGGATRGWSVDSTQAEYVLQPMDLVKVEVFQEPDMERQVRITQDSSITLPLINRVDLKGKTVQQAQDTIRDLYNKDYLVNPQINLTVMEYAKRDVKVLGQVTKAGAVDIPSDRPLKLLDAIALAGGFTRLADRKRVTLTRTGADGVTTTTEINADSIIQSKNSADQWTLQQGDVINVPERLL